MQQSPDPKTIRTAIPPRFQGQRERVLRILERWELSISASRLQPAQPR
ncbi:MAG TPA: hypothetical protein VG692_08445 [Gemmatimonadales bacterium]|nr:hypothetical protein [Gemmatimonadales bacterium]